MANEQERIKLLKVIKDLQSEIASLEKAQEVSSSNSLDNEKKIEAKKKEIVARARELKKANEEIQKLTRQYLEHQKEHEERVGNISDQQFFIKEIEKERIKQYNTIDTKITSNLEKFNEMADLNIRLASLSDYQTAEAASLKLEYLSIAESLDRRGKGVKEQLEILERQNDAAYKYAMLSEKQKELLDDQRQVIEGISKAIQGTIETAITLYGNLQGALGGIVTASGFVADKFIDVNKQLGFTVGDMNKTAASAGLLSFFFDDAAGSVTAIANEFGSLEAATIRTQTQVGLMASTMGISNTEAATLTGQFARMNGGSTDIAADMIATTKEFAKQNNVIPAQALSDLAQNAEAFAKFAKDGGDNMIQAATQARRLGVDMGTTTGIADNLLDFESSITKELELSALLGRSINLNRARALAFEGDIAGATQETVKQLGTIDDFNRMNVIQRQQAADAIGISVAELQKMMANQDTIATQGDVIREKFSLIGSVIDSGLNKYLGVGLKSLGGMITATAQVGGGLSQMGLPIPNLVKGLGQVGKKLADVTGMSGVLGKIGKGFGGAASATPTPASTGGMSSVTSGIEKINPKKLIAGAAAMAIAAGAVFIFAKATQEFMEVTWSAVGKAIVSMAALVGAIVLLGALISGPQALILLAGAAAMLIVASAVWVLGKAIQELAIGFDAMGTVATSLTGLVTLIPQIAMLTVALAGLAGSLALLGTAGLLALPALAGLSMASTGLSLVADILGVGKSESAASIESETLSEYQTKMLEKMDILIDEVRKGKDIYLDREKVTNVVMKSSERRTENIFGLGVA